MNRWWRAIALVAMLFVIGTPATASETVSVEYEMWRLGDLGAGGEAHVVNARGVIGGYIVDPATGAALPAVWTDGEAQMLPLLGGTSGWVNGINAYGQPVGGALDVAGNTRPVLWANDVAIDLGTLGAPNGEATAINAAGQIVGWAGGDQGPAQAFLWTDGQAIALPGLGGMVSRANAINDAGIIVGEADTELGMPRPVMWIDGAVYDLGTLEPLGADDLLLEGGVARDVNATGQVVGFAGGMDMQFHPFLSTAMGIAVLPGADALDGMAAGVNAHGHVVGSADLPTGSSRAWLWLGDQPRPLPSPGMQSAWALDIADDGRIVGTALDADGVTCAVTWELAG